MNKPEPTLQMRLVGAFQCVTDYAKKLRDIPSAELIAVNDVRKKEVKDELLGIRMSIHNAIDAYNEFAGSTGAIDEGELWYLSKVK